MEHGKSNETLTKKTYGLSLNEEGRRGEIASDAHSGTHEIDSNLCPEVTPADGDDAQGS